MAAKLKKSINSKGMVNPEEWLKFIESKISTLSNAPQLMRAVQHYPTGSEKWEAMLYCVKETFMRYFVPDEQEDLYNKPNMVLDADQITADYLIENVDYAFLARDRFSWARQLYAADKMGFFMRVLPYRIGSSKLGQLGAIARNFRAMFLDKDVYESLQKQLGLKTNFDYIHSRINVLSKLYEDAKTPDERIEVLTEVVAFFDIDIYYNTENVQYFPRGMGEQTLFSILTLGNNGGSTQTRGGRCTDLDALLRQTLMAFGVPVTSMRIPAYPTTNDNHEFLWFEWEGQHFNLSPCTNSSRPPNYLQHPYQSIGCALREDWGDWNGASKIVVESKVKMPFTIDFYRGTRSVFIKTEFFDPLRIIDLSTHVTPQPKGTYVYLGAFNEIDGTLDKNGNPINVAAILVTRADDKIIFEKVDARNILYFPHTYSEKLGQDYVTVIGKPFAVMGDSTIFFNSESGGKGVSVNITQQQDQTQPSTSYGVYFFGDGIWNLKTSITTDGSGNATITGIEKNVLYVLAASGWQFLRPWYVNDKGERFIFNGSQQHA